MRIPAMIPAPSGVAGIGGTEMMNMTETRTGYAYGFESAGKFARIRSQVGTRKRQASRRIDRTFYRDRPHVRPGRPVPTGHPRALGHAGTGRAAPGGAPGAVMSARRRVPRRVAWRSPGAGARPGPAPSGGGHVHTRTRNQKPETRQAASAHCPLWPTTLCTLSHAHRHTALFKTNSLTKH